MPVSSACKRIVNSPYLNLLSGLVLLITSGYEVWATFDQAALGAHHGVMVFGVILMLKSLPEIMEGLNRMDEAKKLMDEKTSKSA